MFGVIRLVSYFLVASVAVASPVQQKRSAVLPSVALSNLASATQLSPISLNNWAGISSLNGFDSFFGSNNFDGFNQAQNLLEQQLLCGVGGSGSSIDNINVVQQQLAILAQVAQMAILTQLCEVEAQMLVFQQFLGGLGGFSNDLLRFGGSQPSFDSVIAALGASLFNDNGSLNSVFNFNGLNNGFNGLDIGNSLQLVSSNWNDQFSPESVANALAQAQIASLSSLNNQFGNGFSNNFSNNFNNNENNSNSDNNNNSNNENSSNSNNSSNNSSSSNNLANVAAANGSSD